MIVFICEIFKTQREKIQEDQIQINFTKKVKDMEVRYTEEGMIDNTGY